MRDMQAGTITAYLLANRAFVAPTVEEAVGRLELAGRTRLLDAGTGAGGGLVALARAGDPAAQVLGVDRNPDALALARAHAQECGAASRVETR